MRVRRRARHPGIAVRFELGQFYAMSDKQIALDTIQHLPESVTLADIAKRLDFIAAVRIGLDQIECGETVTHEQVKRELAEWLVK